MPVRRSRLRRAALAGVLVAAALAPAADASPIPRTDGLDPTPAQSVPLAGAPYALALGDHDGDGRPDAYVSLWDARRVVVLRTDADGRLGDPQTVMDGVSAEAVEPVDWDGDGRDDAAIVGGGRLTIVPAAGREAAAVIGAAAGVATGDLDEDGRPDAVVARYDSTSIAIMRNGTRTAGVPEYGPFEVRTACSAVDVGIGDVTGDGHQDVVVPCVSSDGRLLVFPGRGDGTFGEPVASRTGSSPYMVDVADLDGDGIDDVAVTVTGGVQVLRGMRGDGALSAPETYAASGQRRPLLVDLDDDGRPDLVTQSRTGTAGVQYRFSRADGTFGPQRSVVWQADAWDVAAGDVTGDGRQDVVAIARSGDALRAWAGRASGRPQLALAGRPLPVREGEAPVPFDAGLAVTGPEGTTADEAVVTVADGVDGDAVTADVPDGVDVDRDPDARTLRLTADPPVDLPTWQEALRGLRYAYVGDGVAPVAGRRTVRVEVPALGLASERVVDVGLRPPAAGTVGLEGLPVVGEQLAATDGAWLGTEPMIFARTVERCTSDDPASCVPAGALPYAVTDSDVGARLRAVVTATGPDGTRTTAASAMTAPAHALAAPEVLWRPPSETSDTAVEIALRGEPGAAFACALDGGPEAACGATVRFAGLAPGAHVATVVQTLPSGRRSPVARIAFVVRAPAPPPSDPPPAGPPGPDPGPPATPVDPPPGDAAPATPTVELVSRTLRADRRGRHALRLRCEARRGSCRVRVTVTGAGDRLVRRTVKVQAGRTATVRLVTTAALRRLLRRSGRTKVRVRLAGTGGTAVAGGSTVTVTLRR